MPYKNSDSLEKDKMAAAQWAADLLAGKYGDWCILDTETTGLYRAEIIDICILSKYRSPMLNVRLKPKQQIEEGAAHIHGWTNEALADMPEFSSIRNRIAEIVRDKLVIIYNEDFDKQALFHTCRIHQLPRIPIKSDCAMLWYAQFYGEWHNYYGNYRWQKLPSGNHTAYGDCVAVYDLIVEMADYLKIVNAPQPPKDRLFPPKQIAIHWEPKYQIFVNEYRQWGYDKKLFKLNICKPRFYWMTDDNKGE